MNEFFAQTLILISQTIIIAALLSQYIKIVTSKSVKGLSGWAFTLICGSVLAWTAYGIKQGLVIFYVAHIFTALICFSILGHIYSKSKQRRRMELYAIVSGSVLLSLLTIFPDYSGWVGLGYTMVARVPQYKHLLYDKNIKGVSSLAQLLFIIANIFTAIYAQYYDLMPLAISAGLAIASSLFIMFMVAKKSLRAYN